MLMQDDKCAGGGERESISMHACGILSVNHLKMCVPVRLFLLCMSNQAYILNLQNSFYSGRSLVPEEHPI
jgi:hypothetical protein